jgi:hypothetical protein
MYCVWGDSAFNEEVEGTQRSWGFRLTRDSGSYVEFKFPTSGNGDQQNLRDGYSDEFDVWVYNAIYTSLTVQANTQYMLSGGASGTWSINVVYAELQTIDQY